MFLLLFVGLIVIARARPDAEPDPMLKAFFFADPLVLVATWLAAHAMPLAVFAVPVAVVLLAVLALARRWISAPAVVLTTLGVTTGAIVLAQGRGWTALPAPLLWALGTMLLTMVLGRVFCGWICPLGTVHAIASRLLLGARRAKRPPGDCPDLPGDCPDFRFNENGTVPFHTARRGSAAYDPWSPWQTAKYYLLVGLLAMALLGGHWGTIFDPLVLLYRTTTTALFPAAQWASEEGSKAVFQGQPDEGPWRPGVVTEPVYCYLRDHVFTIPNQAFVGAGTIAGFFLVTLLLNAYRRRFWCRYLCPLGALLGLLSWRPLLRRAVRQEDCNGCDLCGMKCPGAAAAAPGRGWMAAECFGCFHCRSVWPRDALTF